MEAGLSAKLFSYDMPVVLDASGAWVACTVRDYRRAEAPSGLDARSTASGMTPRRIGSDVWVVRTTDGHSENVSKGAGSSYAPAWSPDGNLLAFYSDRDGVSRLWIWDRRTGSARRLSDAVVWLPDAPPQWTRDGKQIIAAVLPKDVPLDRAVARVNGKWLEPTPEAAGGSSVTLFQAEATPANNPEQNTDESAARLRARQPVDVVAIDISTGQIKQLVAGVQALSWRLSSDGNRIAITVSRGSKDLQSINDVIVASFSGGEPRSAITVMRGVGLVSWSPNDRWLAYSTTGYGGKGDLMVTLAEGGSTKNLTPEPHPFFGPEYRPPVWDEKADILYAVSGDSLWMVSVDSTKPQKVATIAGHRVVSIVTSSSSGRAWAPAPGTVVLTAIDIRGSYNMSFHQVDMTDGKVTKLAEMPAFIDERYAPRIDVGKNVLVFIREDSQHDQEIWRADPKIANVQPLTHFNDEASALELGKSRLIEWLSSDGTKLRGTLVLPAPYDPTKRYPLIVSQYPGRKGSELVHTFGAQQADPTENVQFLATRGFAVLLPDVNMGYSRSLPRYESTQSLRTSRSPALMRDVANSILPGVNKVIEMGVADPDRLGVIGCSHGGWSTIALITQTTRFRAAVARSGGYYDSPAFYGTLNPDGSSTYTTTSEALYGGSLWDKREVYIDNSPVFFLDRVETPLLLVHGGYDLGIAGAEEVFVDLRRLGREVQLARYDRAGHCGNMSYVDQVDYVNRMIRWFDDHLKRPEDKKSVGTK